MISKHTFRLQIKAKEASSVNREDIISFLSAKLNPINNKETIVKLVRGEEVVIWFWGAWEEDVMDLSITFPSLIVKLITTYPTGTFRYTFENGELVEIRKKRGSGWDLVY